MGYIGGGLRGFTNFRGSADWTEWSTFILFSFFVCSLAFGLDLAMGWDRSNVVTWMRWHPSFEITRLLLVVPCLAVTARRLRGVQRNPWWCLLGLVPILGWIVLLTLIVPSSEEEPEACATERR